MPNALPLLEGPSSSAEIRRLERRIDSGSSLDLFGDFSRLIDLHLEEGNLPEAEEISLELLELAEAGQIRWAIPQINRSDRLKSKAQWRKEAPIFTLLFFAIALWTALWRHTAILNELTNYCLATHRIATAEALLKTEIGIRRITGAREDEQLQWALTQLSGLQLSQGEFQQAEVHAKQALTINPNSRQALSTLVDCYMAQGFDREAETALTRLVGLPPIWRNDHDTIRMIEIYRRRNRLQKAMELVPLVHSFNGTVTAFAAHNRNLPERVTILANLYRDGGMLEISSYLYEQAYRYRGRQEFFIDLLNTRNNLFEYAELCRRKHDVEQCKALLDEAQRLDEGRNERM